MNFNIPLTIVSHNKLYVLKHSKASYMKFFEELSVQTANPIEKQVFETVNEMVKKINDVQFVGIADLLKVAQDAIGKMNFEKKNEVQIADIKVAVEGLNLKMAAERDIKSRNEFAQLAQSPRFVDAIGKLIELGQSDQIEKEQELAKVQAFINAQQLYQGYSALTPRDLALAIQMIETAIESIDVFQKNYQKQIQIKNRDKLSQLKEQLIQARHPLVVCARDILELNNAVIRETNLELSQIGSILSISVLEEKKDLTQFWSQQLNEIISKNSPQPKLIALSQTEQHLDEDIASNPFLTEEELKQHPHISIRNFLAGYVVKNITDTRIIDDMKKRGVIFANSQEDYKSLWQRIISLPQKFYEGLHQAISWRPHLNNYFANYFSAFYLTWGEAQKNTAASISLTEYCYDKYQDFMQALWKGLGYPQDAHWLIKKYENNIADIKERQLARKSTSFEEISLKEKPHVKTQDETGHTIRYERNIPSIDEDLQKKYPPKKEDSAVQEFKRLEEESKQAKLRDKYKQVFSQAKKLLRTFQIFLNKDFPNLNDVEQNPNQDNIISLQRITSEILIDVSNIAININLKRKYNTHDKAKSSYLTESLKTFLEVNKKDSSYENLLKDTLALCLNYSTKLIKPAAQRVVAINWLYHVMEKLNNNSDLEDDEKRLILASALYKVQEESIENHIKISFWGRCGITQSKLSYQISDLLHSHEIKNVLSGDNMLRTNGISSYVEFTQAQNNIELNK